jgi:hypothetical protein
MTVHALTASDVPQVGRRAEQEKRADNIGRIPMLMEKNRDCRKGCEANDARNYRAALPLPYDFSGGSRFGHRLQSYPYPIGDAA